MRWFWTFIALLALLTAVLYTTRIRRAHAAELALARAIAQDDQAAPRPARRPRRDRAQPDAHANAEPTKNETQNQASHPAEPEPTPAEAKAIPQGADTQQEPEPAPQATHEPTPDPETIAQAQDDEELEAAPEPQADERLADAGAEIEQPAPQGDIVIDILPPEPEAQEAEVAQAEAKPDYELLPGGGFRVPDRGIEIPGRGAADAPYVLSWDLLKSVQQGYKPKEGQTDLPQWLGLLEGKRIRIEGNTLVPVIATTTRELLVMQNPWDGCCIGVPPTPYDAVEVTLNHDVDFGNSAVGFGTVEGDFYLDPYVVDGWVLGLYIIEDAKYRSGEGIVFPQF